MNVTYKKDCGCNCTICHLCTKCVNQDKFKCNNWTNEICKCALSTPKTRMRNNTEIKKQQLGYQSDNEDDSDDVAYLIYGNNVIDKWIEEMIYDDSDCSYDDDICAEILRLQKMDDIYRSMRNKYELTEDRIKKNFERYGKFINRAKEDNIYNIEEFMQLASKS